MHVCMYASMNMYLCMHAYIHDAYRRVAPLDNKKKSLNLSIIC